MKKECPHENTEYLGEFQRYKYDLKRHINIPIENVFSQIEACNDCGEERKEVVYRETNKEGLRNSAEHKMHSYKPKETYYTDGGMLAERDVDDNWYYNGEKMTPRQFKAKMKALGDKIGDQEVSDTFKELAHQNRKKADKINYNKAKRLEEIRDEWNK